MITYTISSISIMHLLNLSFLFVVLKFCVCQTPDALSKTSAYEYQLTDDGYTFSFETSNGIKRTETGKSETVNGDTILRVKGRYEFTDPDGNEQVIEYTSDENGFVPKYLSSKARLEPKIGTNVLTTLIGGNNG